MSINKIMLIGRLGRNAEAVQVGDSTILKFSLATDRKWKTKEGEWKSKVTWHNVDFKTAYAETKLPKLIKGAQVYVEGSQEHKDYEKDGQKRKWSFVNCKVCNVLAGDKLPADVTAASAPDDDIPF